MDRTYVVTGAASGIGAATAYPGRPEQMAAVLAWCVSPENSLMTGQIIYVDGGVECSLRGERSW